MTYDTTKEVVDRWRKLVDKLIERTESGKLDWDESAGSDEFVASIGENSVKFGYSDKGDFDGYYFQVENLFGQTIDSFTDDQLDKELEGFPYFNKLRDFFAGVRRKVSGADEVLDRLLQQLEGDDEIPF